MHDWDDLRIFLAVARARRIAAAARMLGIDATTVTRRLARLERRTEQPLFESLGGDRRLTEEGQALLVHAETIEDAVIAATERTGGEAGAGHVRLSVAEGLATRVLAPAIEGFRERYPRIRLDLITASGFLNPSRRESDIALMLARPRSAQLNIAEFALYRLRLYASHDYLARHGTPADPSALERCALIGYVPEHIYAPELDYIAEVAPGLSPKLRSTSINVQHGLIAAGAGIGILPDFMAAGDARLAVVLGETVALHRTFWLVTHRDTHASPRIRAVCAWLAELGETLG
ncbi:LysR family transcriptional regulator [Sphingomonas canadensis]|uniref:LysR family transcriptional regulator n=1 Tax=Sphingomonas canadensis TaxID=1219257 RepID=A0ABW3H6G8_9SPHN|nr:LysR family transcriptional regulator [Sphingomonas canadensis]MCW3836375.1 LysR family transcriptional regulator [Sphingomonas canadensis]